MSCTIVLRNVVEITTSGLAFETQFNVLKWYLLYNSVECIKNTTTFDYGFFNPVIFFEKNAKKILETGSVKERFQQMVSLLEFSEKQL